MLGVISSSTVPLTVGGLSLILKEKEAEELVKVRQTMILEAIARGLGAKEMPSIVDDLERLRHGAREKKREGGAETILTAEKGIFQFLRKEG